MTLVKSKSSPKKKLSTKIWDPSTCRRISLRKIRRKKWSRHQMQWCWGPLASFQQTAGTLDSQCLRPTSKPICLNLHRLDPKSSTLNLISKRCQVWERINRTDHTARLIVRNRWPRPTATSSFSTCTRTVSHAAVTCSPQSRTKSRWKPSKNCLFAPSHLILEERASSTKRQCAKAANRSNDRR